MDAYKKDGYALLCGKLGYFPVSKESAMIIKTDIDLKMAESLLRASSGEEVYEVQYDELATARG